MVAAQEAQAQAILQQARVSGTESILGEGGHVGRGRSGLVEAERAVGAHGQ